MAAAVLFCSSANPERPSLSAHILGVFLGTNERSNFPTRINPIRKRAAILTATGFGVEELSRREITNGIAFIFEEDSRK